MRLRRGALASALLIGLFLSRKAVAQPISYRVCSPAGVSLHVIDADLNDHRVTVSPALAAAGVGRCESFTSFISRLRPSAAINGTFFSKRNLRPIGDIVIEGRLRYFGGMGTALAFASDGVDVVRLPKSQRVDWSEHRAALAGGPLLVWDGFAKPRPGGEGFGDPHVFARAAPRTAVGITPSNHLLLVTTTRGSSLGGLAKAMVALGAIYAVNMDGGSSCGMYYQGRTVRGAARLLTNVLAVYVRPEAKARPPLRAPKGLDWRSGHRPRPSFSFAAKGTKIATTLPRRWEQQSAIHVKSSKPLAQGWTVRVHIDQKRVETITELPASVSLDLSHHEPNVDHEIWLSAVDAEGKTAGHGERLFRLGEVGVRK